MKKLVLLLSLIICTSLASAVTVNFNFDNTANVVMENPGLIYSDAVVFQVQTTDHVLCRYSTSKGTAFNSMTGSFNDNFETIHKKILTSLSDGVYRYYVRCRDIKNLDNVSSGIYELEAIFTISKPIAGQIILDESPLKEGRYELQLITTKIPSNTPKLSYSYDSISYRPIILHGLGTSWSGYLIISETEGEKIGSFKFEASDLEGRPGSSILGENIFIVDTVSPKTPIDFEAIGKYSRVRLQWHLDSEKDVNTINIYKSESQNVQTTDFYKSIDASKEYYEDSEVSSGKTYYYRISTEDEAENIADLTYEVKATTLLENSSSSSNSKATLSPELLGTVDALLTEVDLLQTDIDRMDSTINSYEDREKEQLKTIGITDSIGSAKSELNALRREVETYKLQDISSEVLSAKLSSSRLKLNILKKKVPDSINEIESVEKVLPITEDSIRRAILSYSAELSQSDVDKAVKRSLEAIDGFELKTKTIFKSFDIIYIDGTKASKTLIEHTLEHRIPKTTSAKFLLSLPQGSIDSSTLSLKNTNYVVEGDNLISFEADTNKITYQLNKKLSSEVLDDIFITLFISSEESSGPTGYFLSGIPGTNSLGVGFLILIAISLVTYLYYMRTQNKSDTIMSFIEKAKTVKSLQRSGESEKASSLYESLKIDYLGLSAEEKTKVFKKVKNLTKAK